MFKLGRLTDYAVVVLIDIYTHSEKSHNATRISARTGIALPTVQKILKILSAGDILTSQRGVQGGYQLSQSPNDISIASILTVMEGPIALTACVEGGDGDCRVENICTVKGRWDKVNEAVEKSLNNVKLSHMVEQGYKSSPFMPLSDEKYRQRDYR